MLSVRKSLCPGSQGPSAMWRFWKISEVYKFLKISEHLGDPVALVESLDTSSGCQEVEPEKRKVWWEETFMSSLIIFTFNSSPELLQSGAVGSSSCESGPQTDACSSSSSLFISFFPSFFFEITLMMLIQFQVRNWREADTKDASRRFEDQWWQAAKGEKKIQLRFFFLSFFAHFPSGCVSKNVLVG